MDNPLDQTEKRKTASLRPDHHRALMRRRAQSHVKLQALLDEALEAGLRVKRWLPAQEMVEAA